ncbi:hypothetical protein [uncultured Methanobrevibacter sp.]|uniref:hypothetical protein n=1 Tax=uncultured Methanobrevibacter sp. TaxID=253161 RepID=UPI0025D763BD|nr:hypothetical protein [uncultured Methanobrevibacter sp.]
MERFIGDNVFTFEDVKEFAAEMCVHLHGKLFRRDLIQDIEFQRGRIFEDYPFFLEALIKAKRMYFFTEHLYHKREREKSIMTSYDESYLDFVDVIDFSKDVAKRYGIYEEFKPYLFQYYIRTNQFMIMQLSLKTRLKYFKKMKEKYTDYKNEIEEIYYDLFFIYQTLFDSCLKSSNYITYEIRKNYLFRKNKEKFWQERKMENSEWEKN